MTTEKSWALLLAVAAGAAGAAAMILSRSRHHRRAAHLGHKADIRSWENEGGGLRVPAATRQP